MSVNKIRAFRKSLREFERLNQLLNNQCCRGITLAQCHVLLEIEELENATTSHLAHNLKLDKSTLSRTVDSLVKMDLVERTENPDDRRYKTLILSSAGRIFCNRINGENDKLYSEVIRKLPSTSKDTILDHFTDLIRAMASCYESSGTGNKCCD